MLDDNHFVYEILFFFIFKFSIGLYLHILAVIHEFYNNKCLLSTKSAS